MTGSTGMDRSKEALLVFLDFMDWSGYDADRNAGVSLGRTGGYLSDRSLPSERYLNKLAKASGLSSDWNSLVLPKKKPAVASQPIPIVPQAPRSLATDEVDMPYVGTIPAGNWGTPLEEIDQVPMNRKHARPGHVVVKIEGSSLYPFLVQGDLVVIRPESAPTDRKIIVAQKSNGNEATIKELRIDPNTGESGIFPLNRSESLPDEVDQWRAVMIAVGLRRLIDNIPGDFYKEEGLTARFLRLLPTGLEGQH
ncbi:hypothetical protein EON81_12825 [bacterium]|nr:MAG: hypothetical protein EON81_12825 [bacterium]